MQDFMLFAKCDQIFYKPEHFTVSGFISFPVKPGNLIVQTIWIVVAKLRVAELIPGKDHRRSCRQKQHTPCIFHLTVSKLQNFLFAAFSFFSAVPAVILHSSVTVLLAVIFIVTFFIRYQVT